MGPDPSVDISARQISQEPMVGLTRLLVTLKIFNGFPKYIIINLGMSKNFGDIDFEHLTFPTHLRVDYIRVYQDIRHINVGCDPKGYPTLDYINEFVKLPCYKMKLLTFSLSPLLFMKAYPSLH